MDKFSTCIGRKMQFCQDANFSQLHLSIQCNPNSQTIIFMDISKLGIKFAWKRQRPIIANLILKEKDKVGGQMLSTSRITLKLQ